ncbi:MAG: VOC family protein [Pirellulaceae bacterium]
MKARFRILLGMSLCSVLPGCGAPQDAGPGAIKSDVGSEAPANQGRPRRSNDSGDSITSTNEPSQPGVQPMFTLKHPVIDLGIVCSDFDESVHFYRDLLGLKVVLEIHIPGDLAKELGLAPTKFRHVRLKAGDTLLKLMEIESPPQERTFDFQAGVRWLTFIVEDVPACVARLKAAGVEFVSEPLSAPDAKHVVCAKGPDGMLIEFVQLRD